MQIQVEKDITNLFLLSQLTLLIPAFWLVKTIWAPVGTTV